MEIRKEIQQFIDNPISDTGSALCVFTPTDFKYHPQILLFDDEFVTIKTFKGGVKVPFVYKIWGRFCGYGISNSQYKWVTKFEFEELKNKFPYVGEHLEGDFGGLKNYMK